MSLSIISRLSPGQALTPPRPEAAAGPMPGAWGRRALSLAWLVLILFAGGVPVHAATRVLHGVASFVPDGDTLWLRPVRGGPARAVRLRGLDAPEICQAYGPSARLALLSRVQAQPLALRTHGRDRYGRLLAEVATPALPDVGAWLVAQGHAWSSHYRGRRGPYAGLELQARAERRGLWAEAGAVEPRRFRRVHGSCHH